MPARMCGASRTTGAVYVSCPLAEYGRPLEDFICDPPIPVDLTALGVSALGMTLFEREGVTHLLDVVGEEHYPNVADFLEEVRRLGLSRKISRRTDFARLSPQSKIILIHRRAHIENADEYQGVRQRLHNHPSDHRWCPKGIEEHEHLPFRDMCAGLWWEDIAGGEDLDENGIYRTVERQLPCGAYHGWRRPDHVLPHYQYAIFAAFPVEQLDVIAGGGNETADSYARASQSSVPVQIVEE